MKRLFIIAIAALMLAACTKQKTTGTKTITFTASVFSQTRYHEPMTDLWIFDYYNGTLFQQLHQSSTDDDFGSPTLTMPCGSHTVYCAMSRGLNPTVETDVPVIWFSKPDDTFWNTTFVDVTPSTTPTQQIMLNRIVSKLTLVVEDAIKEGTTYFNLTPQNWYYGFNYTTGEPDRLYVEQPFVFGCPNYLVGTNYNEFSVFGFSQQETWNTDVTLQAVDIADEVICEAWIPDVPIAANRATTYTGKLFVSDFNGWVLLNDEWGDPFNGGW